MVKIKKYNRNSKVYTEGDAFDNCVYLVRRGTFTVSKKVDIPRESFNMMKGFDIAETPYTKPVLKRDLDLILISEG